MKLIAQRAESDDLCIIGAIEGIHNLVTPGEDNDKSAFVTDLRDEAA